MKLTVVQLGAALLLLCSCALAGGGGAEDEPAPEPILTLHVENQNFYDATLYAVSRGGQRQRLGVVGGHNQATLTFRWLHQELRVLIQLLAGGSTATDMLMVSPGDSLNLVIQADLHVRIPEGIEGTEGTEGTEARNLDTSSTVPTMPSTPSMPSMPSIRAARASL